MAQPHRVRQAAFTPRQVEIVGLIAIGLGDKEIARRLGVSVTTIRTHLQRLYRELGAHTRAEAVAEHLARTALAAESSKVTTSARR